MHRSAVGERAARGLGGTLALSILLCGPVWAASPVFVDAAGSCDGNTPCFTTIQAGVNNAGPDSPSFVIVYPGTYAESVNLSLMGSAIPDTPHSIIIAQAGLLEGIVGFSSTALSAASVPPELASAGVESAMAEAEAELANLSAQMADMPPVADVALGTVLVQPLTGPAFYNSVMPFPASIGIYGIDVLSADTDGVHLNASNDISMVLVNANGNAKDGLDLTSTAGGVAVAGCNANMNGDNGVLARAVKEIDVFNSIADDNMSAGMDLHTADDILVYILPPELLTDLTLPTQSSASRNKSIGFVATSTGGAVNVIDFSILSGDFTSRAIHFDDNTGTGVQVSAFEGFTLYGATANGNGGFGVEANAGDEVAVAASDVNENGSTGVTAGAKSFLCFAAGANGNEGDGWGVDVSGTPADGPLSPLYPSALTMLACSGDHNTAHGFDLTAPASGAVVQAATAIGNTGDGIRLEVLAGSASDLTGGIICENGAGVRLLSNANVNAEGCWWGNVTGPFHATKNPGGTGNQVVDALSGGGMGDVDFLPFIDTVTASAMSTHAGSPTEVRFQFSGGGGTVFLGSSANIGFPSLGPGSTPPFELSTDNGFLTGFNETGTTVHSFINELPGTVVVELTPLRTGTSTVTLEGPCGLTGTAQVAVGPFPAPALSLLGLLAATLVLSAVAFAAMRRPVAKRRGI